MRPGSQQGSFICEPDGTILTHIKDVTRNTETNSTLYSFN